MTEEEIIKIFLTRQSSSWINIKLRANEKWNQEGFELIW